MKTCGKWLISIGICALIVGAFVFFGNVGTEKQYAVVDMNGSGSAYCAEIRFWGDKWSNMSNDSKTALVSELITMAGNKGAVTPYEITAVDADTRMAVFSYNSEEGLVEFGKGK